MGTIAFCEILCGIVRQSRFRLVHEFNWSSRRSLCYRICKENFKNQVPGVRFSLAPTLYRSVLFYTCQGSNIITMPKIKPEKSSDFKHKDKKGSKNLKHSKSSSLKLIKKKKKKKHHHHHHHHKRKHSKKRSSGKKTLEKKRPELILLDSSCDSDILFLYDSRTNKGKSDERGACSKLTGNEKSGKIVGHSEEREKKDNFKETHGDLISRQELKQNSPEKETSENICVVKEQGNCNTIQSISSGDGISSVLKSDQAVSGPSGIQKDNSNHINRKWEFSNFVETMAKETEDSTNNERIHLMFNVLSYNVLCQEILEDHMDLYKFHNPSALNWEYRSKLLMKEFVDFDADVMCLQEVQESHLKSFYSELQRIGYTGLFKQRTGDKKDGVAIYFKNSTFEMVDYTTVEFYQPGVQVLNRDNVGLIVKLAPRMKPDERIIVATTHLLYNPRRHDVKLAQAQLLLAEVERFAFKEIDERTKATKYWPVILTGDMNFEPNSGGFQLLNMGWFRYDGLCSKTLTTDFCAFGRMLGKELIPSYLGVTDTCQHWTMLMRRSVQSTTEPVLKSNDDHKTEIKLLQIYNSDFKRLHSSPSTNLEILETKEFYMKSHQKRFGSGQLKHPLELTSVYRFDSEECFSKSQVSTFQEGWVVVDYIFYSNDGTSDGATSQEGNLKLVARYKLLSANEAAKVGPIPNLSSPSDHYPLAAKFALFF